MYFSAKQYQNYLNNRNNPMAGYARSSFAAMLGAKEFVTKNPYGDIISRMPEGYQVTEEQAAVVLEKVKTALVKREYAVGNVSMGKWLRPWTVVPELAAFHPPAGEFAAGVEVELGFTSKAAAQRAAAVLIEMDHVTLDWEGPAEPIEATFPPHIVSDMHNSYAVKYLDYLASVPKDIYSHDPGSYTGTHINVSYTPTEGTGGHGARHLEQVNNVLRGVLNSAEQQKYFGRRPYNYGFMRGERGHQWIEWKLFNSQTDSDRLQQYVNIAVELTRLSYGSVMPTVETVKAALEAGFNKPIVSSKKAVEQPAEEATTQKRRSSSRNIAA